MYVLSLLWSWWNSKSFLLASPEQRKKPGRFLPALCCFSSGRGHRSTSENACRGSHLRIHGQHLLFRIWSQADAMKATSLTFETARNLCSEDVSINFFALKRVAPNPSSGRWKAVSIVQTSEDLTLDVCHQTHTQGSLSQDGGGQLRVPGRNVLLERHTIEDWRKPAKKTTNAGLLEMFKCIPLV